MFAIDRQTLNRQGEPFSSPISFGWLSFMGSYAIVVQRCVDRRPTGFRLQLSPPSATQLTLHPCNRPFYIAAIVPDANRRRPPATAITSVSARNADRPGIFVVGPAQPEHSNQHHQGKNTAMCRPRHIKMLNSRNCKCNSNSDHQAKRKHSNYRRRPTSATTSPSRPAMVQPRQIQNQ